MTPQCSRRAVCTSGVLLVSNQAQGKCDKTCGNREEGSKLLERKFEPGLRPMS